MNSLPTCSPPAATPAAPELRADRDHCQRPGCACPAAPGPCAVWEHGRVTTADEGRRVLVRRGFALEYLTLGWNVAGIVVLGFAAYAARSVALAGFALDSLIEIGASTVVIWELSGTGEQRQCRGLRLIGYAFALSSLGTTTRRQTRSACSPWAGASSPSTWRLSPEAPPPSPQHGCCVTASPGRSPARCCSASSAAPRSFPAWSTPHPITHPPPPPA